MINCNLLTSGLSIPCASSVTNNPYNSTVNVLNTFSFQIISGYNILMLTQPIQVAKGSLIYLTQSTGRLALDQSGTATYCDLMWQTYAWTKLSTNSNWRFYLNTFDDFSVYQNSLNLVHKYSSPGVYVVTIAVKSLVVQQLVTVNECNILN